MTFEQLLVKYLYQHKQVSLQGFGTISLNSTIPDIEVINKNRQIPIEGASFFYNMKAQTDENFVLFFSQQRGKIKPLAESDIESHLQLARQLMNIGKPYEVEGLGIFAMGKDGSVVLQSGNYAVPFADNAGQPPKLRERTEQQEKTEAESSGTAISARARKVLVGAGVLLALLVAGWLIWSKFLNDNPQAGISPVSAQDSLLQNITPVPDTSLPGAAVTSADTTPAWRAYFRSFTGTQRIPALLSIYAKYDSIKVETADSINYRMYINVKSPVADTAYLADSLTRMFLRPVTLERQVP